MIDIETLGKNSNAIIVSIGAVAFDPETGEIGDTYYNVISPYSSEAWGLRPDMSTIIWWMRQSPEARDALFGKDVEWDTLKPALEKLSLFINNVRGTGPAPYIWARDPDFDCKLLQNAFEKCNVKVPWQYNKCLSCRTAEYYFKEKYKSVPVSRGVYHHALDDAIYQAKCVIATHGGYLETPESEPKPHAINTKVETNEENVTIS